MGINWLYLDDQTFSHLHHFQMQVPIFINSLRWWCFIRMKFVQMFGRCSRVFYIPPPSSLESKCHELGIDSNASLLWNTCNFKGRASQRPQMSPIVKRSYTNSREFEPCPLECQVRVPLYQPEFGITYIYLYFVPHWNSYQFLLKLLMKLMMTYVISTSNGFRLFPTRISLCHFHWSDLPSWFR